MGIIPAKLPHLQLERVLLESGYQLIAGLDEAGRGAWAGPVVAAAVVMPIWKTNLAQILHAVRDSKLMTPVTRERVYPLVRQVALATGIGVTAAADVDRHGIVTATRIAMRAAIGNLGLLPDYLLIDALHLPRVSIPQRGIPKGDLQHLSIAAASIVAKVTRDRLLGELDQMHPGYGFAQHKGYGTRRHSYSLAKLGPCPIHRYSFSPVRAALQG